MNSPELKVFSQESDVNIVGGKLKYIAHFSDFEYLATGTMRGVCRVILISEINYYSHRIYGAEEYYPAHSGSIQTKIQNDPR